MYKIKVSNMNCSNCSNRISNILKENNYEFQIILEEKLVIVEKDYKKVISLLKKNNYQAKLEK